VAITTDQKLEYGVRLRLTLNTAPGLEAIAALALLRGLLDLLSLGIVLTDQRFAPAPLHAAEGEPWARYPVGDGGGQIKLKADPSGRLHFWHSVFMQESIALQDGATFVSSRLLRMLEARYTNPWDVLVGAAIPAAVGGGLVGFLSWLALVRPTRRKADADADADAAEIAAQLAAAQMWREADEAAERARMAAAERRRLEAEAEAAEIANVKQLLLLAQDIEDYLDSTGRGDRWSEQLLGKLLERPASRAALQLVPLLKPDVEVVPEPEDI
jgi:hypothetical protein